MTENPFRTPGDYEYFLYSLEEQYPFIRRSTLVFERRGASLARLAGELFFDYGVRISVRERLIFHRLPLVIDWYGYEVWRDDEKLYWYDPQPHPDVPSLQSTHPHHKHVPPHIKQNRISAPDMSFDRPNLPALLREVAGLLATMGDAETDPLPLA